MSRVTELAAEEAARAEAEDETADEDETSGAEPDGEEEEAAEEEEQTADEPSAASEPPFANVGEAELRRANRAVEDQKARLAKILGDAAVAHDCLLCGGTGYLPELPPYGVRMIAVEGEDGPGLIFEAPEPEEDYPDAKDKAACDWCDAQGFVKTGSKNPNAATAPCSKCNGNGWVTVAVVETPAIPALPQAAAAVPVPAGNGLEGTVDTWGRPWGHKHFGVPPAQIQG